MNLALIPSSFHPHLGGVEELTRQLALTQLSQGHNPLICTNRWPKDLPATENLDGLEIKRYIFRVPAKPGKITWAANLLGPLALRSFCSDLNAHGAKLLHVQCVSSNSHYALAAKEKTGLPLVVTLQGELTMDAAGIFQWQDFARDMLRRVLDGADAITACSDKSLRDAEHFYGREFNSRGRVIFNGVRLSDFQNATPHPHPRPYIFALGRLVPQKGFDILIKAKACPELASHDVLLAGDGPEEARLKQLARDENVSDRIHFLGRANRQQVISLFTGCEIFALPSRADEGLPVVAAESLAAGKPAVATRTGGTPEAILDQQTGLLIDRENVDAFRAALIRLIRDPDMREKMAGAAKQRAAEFFDWTNISDQYNCVYKSLCHARD